MLVLSAEDVESIVAKINYEDLVQLMRTVFEMLSASPSIRDPAEGQGEGVASPLRTIIHSQKQITLFMPSRLAVAGGSGIKVVSIPRQGASPNGPPATTLLLDDDTGRVNAIVNATQLTALRNAAGSSYLLTLLLHFSAAQLFLM
jgi:ornithine cyclodeaminase/alanine dehydrogenase-like protein (mu-crystallin family)